MRTARVWCGRCRGKRTLHVVRAKLTRGGVIRSRGRCPHCGGPVEAILGKIDGEVAA